jgi:hypothetical protein
MSASVDNEAVVIETPEAELWTEVINLAIFDLSSEYADLRRPARNWLMSASERVGSFIWSCHAIGVEPGYIRAALAKKQAQM